MKQHLPNVVIVFVFLVMACYTRPVVAQCLCSGGIAPNALEHVIVLSPTSSSSTVLSFPKFDPAMGILNCVALHDTVSIVARLGIRSLDSVDNEYQFRLTINTTVSGPSLSRNNFVDTYYGPDSVGRYGSPTDSINYGPDTVYKGMPSVKTNNSNVTPYLGSSGVVNFNYIIGGGVTSLAGGINFNSSVRTQTWGIFKLTYFWCENSVLATNIKSFWAVKKENAVQLQWVADNEQSTNIYEIQISYDGRNFTTVGQALNGNAVEGAATKYEYQYLLSQVAAGKLYFRIKQKGAGGKITYSPVRIISLSQSEPGEFRLFPNPVTNKVSMQFDRMLSGSYWVSIVNAGGQVIYTRTLRISNSSLLQIDLPATPPAGLYYLRVKDVRSGAVYTDKLRIQ